MRDLPVNAGAWRLGGWAGVLAALLAACQLATILHLALVPHSLGADGHLNHVRAPAAVSARAGVPPAAALSAGSRDQADHPCAVEAVLRALAAVEAPPAQAGSTPAFTAAALPRLPAAAPVRSLHRLAPKQSPPAQT